MTPNANIIAFFDTTGAEMVIPQVLPQLITTANLAPWVALVPVALDSDAIDATLTLPFDTCGANAALYLMGAKHTPRFSHGSRRRALH